MEFQLISAMLVILFFLLYREHRIGQKKLAETFKSEIDRLHHEIRALEPVVREATDVTGPVCDKVDSTLVP